VFQHREGKDMAKKIADLDSISGSLSGSEYLEVSQSNVSKKILLTDILDFIQTNLNTDNLKEINSSSSSSSSNSSSSGVPSWVSYFDDNYWEINDNGTWQAGDNEWASSGGGELALLSIGTWVEGYRPTQIRITFTGVPNVSFTLGDGTHTISSAGSYSSGVAQDITFVGNDIATLDMGQTDNDPFQVTNIEFS
jgi:hypothetical protein